MKNNPQEEAFYDTYYIDTFVSSKCLSSLIESKKLKIGYTAVHAGHVTDDGTVIPSIVSCCRLFTAWVNKRTMAMRSRRGLPVEPADWQVHRVAAPGIRQSA